MKSFINNIIAKAKAFFNGRIAKMILTIAITLGIAYALGHVFKIITFTTLAFKGLLKAFAA